MRKALKGMTAMTGHRQWNYTPYQPADIAQDGPKPTICRLAPASHSVELEWFDKGSSAPHTLFWAEHGSDSFSSMPIQARQVKLEQLSDKTEYELVIANAEGVKSNVRLVLTGDVPGRVVNYLHPQDDQYHFSGQYLASPSIVKLENGALLSSMDVFAGNRPQNLTLIFRSDDGGQNWHYVTELFPCFWGKLFTHRGSLYMLGMSNEYGDLLIGRSDDEGLTWAVPTPIMRGSACTMEKGLHKAPMPIIRAHGRLWTEVDFGSWNCGGFGNSIFSIDENADLCAAENWSCTGFLHFDSSWPKAGDYASSIEGNAVEAPDGSIVALMRYGENKALLMKMDYKNPEARPEFVEFIDFPMGHTKFEVQRHPDGSYYAVGNRLPLRTILSVFRSTDLRHWDFVRDIENQNQMPVKEVGFQYPAFLFDGDDLLVLSRTAFNKANNFHDSNMQTFYRVALK